MIELLGATILLAAGIQVAAESRPALLPVPVRPQGWQEKTRTRRDATP